MGCQYFITMLTVKEILPRQIAHGYSSGRNRCCSIHAWRGIVLAQTLRPGEVWANGARVVCGLCRVCRCWPQNCRACRRLCFSAPEVACMQIVNKPPVLQIVEQVRSLVPLSLASGIVIVRLQSVGHGKTVELQYLVDTVLAPAPQ